MICNRERSERLHLSKGDQDIYIDNCKIPQHHIDGIRFLYRQYKKGRSGVIINYGPEYGRNLQIVLFLKAVHNLLKKPVLVLCKEGAEHNWMEQFQTWTDFYDEVVLETEKPFIKKLVLINTLSNLPAFSRHEWSMVIVDDDESSYQVIKLPFKADYKIYTTSVNMKENLDKFSLIYKWLYPDEGKDKGKWKFDKNDFIANKHNKREIIDKAILLDAFMEDIVATNNTIASCNEDHQTVTHATYSSPPKTVSRKNKDATGTKIKRSKRKEDDDDIPLIKTKSIYHPKVYTKVKSLNLSNSDETLNNILASNNESDDENDDFSIGNFKKKRKRKFNKDVMLTKNSEEVEIKMDNIDSQSLPNLYYEPDSVTDSNSDMFYEMDTLEFSDVCDERGENINDPIIDTSNLDKNYENKEINIKVDDEVVSELDTNTENKIKSSQTAGRRKVKNISESDEDVDLNKSPLLLCSETDSKDNEFEITKESTPIDDEIKSDEDVDLCKSPLPIDKKADSRNNEFEKAKESTPIDDEIESNDSDVKLNISFEDSPSICSEMNLDDNEIKSKSLLSDINEINQEIDKKSSDKEFEAIEKIDNDINTNHKLNEVHAESEQNGFNEEINIVESEKGETTVNTLKRNCFEDEIRDMEEKALKKFKGSILDNLF